MSKVIKRFNEWRDHVSYGIEQDIECMFEWQRDMENSWWAEDTNLRARMAFKYASLKLNVRVWFCEHILRVELY
jgi:hypothetical protein